MFLKKMMKITYIILGLIYFCTPAHADRLTNLTLENTALSPSFNNQTFSYTAQVNHETDTIQLTATGRRNSTLTLNNTPLASGIPSGPLDLSVGPNVFRITASGRRDDTYTITVNRNNSGTGDDDSTADPHLSIQQPVMGAQFQVGEVITFEAGIAGNTDIFGATFHWVSSIDGPLGSGPSLSTALNLGIHTITANIILSDGSSLDTAVTISVGRPITQQNPNILFIVADDLGAESSSLYPQLVGTSGAVATPNLEALAQRGLTFDNAWSNPACSPTRGAVISGQYGHTNGVTGVGDTMNNDSTTSIWELIDEDSPEEYTMATFGKWHVGSTIEHVQNAGITEFKGFLGGLIRDYFNWQYLDINGNATTTNTYSTTLLSDFAIDFIESQSESHSPWFVYLPYNAPHGVAANTGFQVPPAHLHSVDVGDLQPGDIEDSLPVYKSMVQALDTEIGRVIAALGDDINNTLIIFIGDNGTPPAVKDTNSGLAGSKSFVTEGGVRVPFVIAGPGVTRQGEREAALVSTTDLYSTIAYQTGIPNAQIGDSFNLSPLLTDANAQTGRNLLFTEICTANSSRYAIKNPQYKLLHDSGIWRMYDLITDPRETNNLYNVPDFATIRATMHEALEDIQSVAGPYGCFQ